MSKSRCGINPQDRCSIINCSSIYGFMTPRFDIYEDPPMTKEVEYVTTKAAIIQLTRYLAQYLKGKGVRVNCIKPRGDIRQSAATFCRQIQCPM